MTRETRLMMKRLFGLAFGIIGVLPAEAGDSTFCLVNENDRQIENESHINAEDKRISETDIEGDDINTMKKKPLLLRLFNTVTDYVMDCDSNYVTRVPYWFSAEAQTSYWHDYYYMRSSDTHNYMTIESDPSLVVGGSLYYSIIGYGISYNLNDIGKPKGEMNGTGIRQSLLLNTAKFVLEYYTFNSGKTAEITSVSNIDITGKNNKFKGLDARCNGLSFLYIFNNKRFSWPSAYEGCSAVQRRSAGSWSLGFHFSHQRIRFNDNELPEYIKAEIDPTLMFDEVNYHDYSINSGYSYNWVLGHNWLFNVSTLPSIGYRRSNITESEEEHSILNNVSTDLNFRSSLTWNNTKLFTQLKLDLHTYSYRKEKFGLTNTYGTLSFVAGFNFLK